MGVSSVQKGDSDLYNAYEYFTTFCKVSVDFAQENTGF